MKTLTQFICEKNEMVVAIANELKKNGYNQSKVTVKYRSLTWDSAIEVTIRDLKIEQENIEKIVKKFEKVHWDDKTQEILTGGNTYIDVKYDDKQVYSLKGKPEYKNILNSMKANVDQWIQLKNKLEVRLPKGYWGSEDLVYEYKLKNKMYTKRDKDFIRPLWRLLYKTGNI